MELSLWQQCLHRLRDLIPQQQISQWFNPLQAEQTGEGLILFAPNQYILETINRDYMPLLRDTWAELTAGNHGQVSLVMGNKPVIEPREVKSTTVEPMAKPLHASNLNVDFTLDNFVEGKSNQLALAAGKQVVENPGSVFNPLCIVGHSGLGKTHLMQAVGNAIKERNRMAKVVYLHSERFVADMVTALQDNRINEFKKFYRSLDALLIDDIQFFSGKERSQEEFFHTFNALLEDQQQVILTSDRYPKEMSGIEERLKSRFGAGLIVAVQPPELETRVAILINKAIQAEIELPHEVAFFIAKRIRSNVRELEGALKRVIANAKFIGAPITVDFAREALKDLLAVHDKLISIDNIMRTVANYFKVTVTELLSKRRSRSVARPRQIAMFLCKELTNHSLPEIGEAFGGRDHTTVLHACRQIKQMKSDGTEVAQDLTKLLQILST